MGQDRERDRSHDDPQQRADEARFALGAGAIVFIAALILGGAALCSILGLQ